MQIWRFCIYVSFLDMLKGIKDRDQNILLKSKWAGLQIYTLKNIQGKPGMGPMPGTQPSPLLPYKHRQGTLTRVKGQIITVVIITSKNVASLIQLILHYHNFNRNFENLPIFPSPSTLPKDLQTEMVASSNSFNSVLQRQKKKGNLEHNTRYVYTNIMECIKK